MVNLDEAIYQKPDYVDAYFLKGVIYFEAEAYGDAADSFGKLLKIAPNHFEGLRYAAYIAHISKQSKVAMELINRMRKINKDEAEKFAASISSSTSSQLKKLAIGAAGLALVANPDVIGKAFNSVSNAIDTGEWKWQ